jgi:ABC-type phosphate/phosphonate transport system substrate-binding protein
MTTVDQNMQKVLEGRVQMAALDKELFASLAEGQPPQKKAKLALVLAHVREDFRAELRGGKGRHR